MPQTQDSRSTLIDVEIAGQTSRFRLSVVDPAAPVALIAPALGVAAHSYLRLAAELTRLGVNSLIVEARGVGESPLRARRGVDWGYLDLVDGELQAAWRLARERLPLATPHWVGHSLGGQLALLHQARHPQQATDSVILIGAGAPYYRCWPRGQRTALRAFAWLARLSSQLLGVFRGDWWRFGGPQGARLMIEWSGFARHGRLDRLGADHWDADAALRTLARPILAICLRGDRYAPRASTRHLVGMTAGTCREQSLDDIGLHQPPGHFLWMRHPTAAAAQMAAWMRRDR